MERNTGKPSEEEFESIITRYGKRAFLERLADAAEIKARTGRIGKVRAQVSDYILVLDGKTEWAEVKSTQDPTAFRFSLLKTKQKAKAAMITTAGGSYVVYIQRLPHGDWYRVPYHCIHTHTKASMTWESIRTFKWNPNFMT
jgi:penicillin-binding protein-related factor A (putative recombinase)